MERKLVKQGRNALTVTLPANWIKEKNLKPGNQVHITKTGSDLVIKSDNVPEKKEITINITLKDWRYLQYILNNQYRIGYDKITLKGEFNPSDLYKALRLLTGFDISEQETRLVVIENVTEPIVNDPAKPLKQLFFIIKQDLEYVISSLKSKQKIDFERISLNAERINKTHNLILRVLSKTNPKRQSLMWDLANMVSRFYRQVYYLAKALNTKRPVDISPKVIEFIETVYEVFTDLYFGIFKKSLKYLEKIHTKYEYYETKRHEIYLNKDLFSIIVLNYFGLMFQYCLRSTGSATGIITSETCEK
ncbi:phosphate uptake regulator PhoU [Candidatus Woesearchaeota archaeon]|jgi:phosphate uptake regulator|nr:phosphate uptake regulator PhoU [Candidatus Woesearchaeota archaeon]